MILSDFGVVLMVLGAAIMGFSVGRFLGWKAGVRDAILITDADELNLRNLRWVLNVIGEQGDGTWANLARHALQPDTDLAKLKERWTK